MTWVWTNAGFIGFGMSSTGISHWRQYIFALDTVFPILYGFLSGQAIGEVEDFEKILGLRFKVSKVSSCCQVGW